MHNKIHYYRVQLVAYDLVRRSRLRLPMRIPSPYPTPLPPSFPSSARRRTPRKLQLLPLPPLEETPHLE